MKKIYHNFVNKGYVLFYKHSSTTLYMDIYLFYHFWLIYSHFVYSQIEKFICREVIFLFYVQILHRSIQYFSPSSEWKKNIWKLKIRIKSNIKYLKNKRVWQKRERYVSKYDSFFSKQSRYSISVNTLMHEPFPALAYIVSKGNSTLYDYHLWIWNKHFFCTHTVVRRVHVLIHIHHW